MFHDNEKEDQILELREQVMLDAVGVISDENDMENYVRMLDKFSVQSLSKDLQDNVLPDSPNNSEFFMHDCRCPGSRSKVQLLKLVQLNALNEFLEEGTYVTQSKETNHPDSGWTLLDWV